MVFTYSGSSTPSSYTSITSSNRSIPAHSSQDASTSFHSTSSYSHPNPTSSVLFNVSTLAIPTSNGNKEPKAIDTLEFLTTSLNTIKSKLVLPSSKEIGHLAQSKSELFRLHERIAQLETQLLKKQSDAEVQTHFLKHELETTKKELKAYQDECEKLKKHRRHLYENHEQLQKKASKLEDELKESKSKYHSEVAELKRHQFQLEEKLSNIQTRYDQETKISNQKIHLLEASMEALDNEVDTLQSRCHQYAEENQVLNRKLIDQTLSLEKLELQLSNQPIQTLRLKASELKAKELDQQHQYLQSLEFELQTYRRQCEQLQLDRSRLSKLEEEKLSLTQQVKAMDHLRSQVIEKESECEALRVQLQVWTQSDFTPHQADQHIQSLMKELENQKQLETMLHQRLESMETQKSDLQVQVQELLDKQAEVQQQYWSMYTHTKTLESTLVHKDQEILDLKDQVQLWTQFTESSTLSLHPTSSSTSSPSSSSSTSSPSLLNDSTL